MFRITRVNRGVERMNKKLVIVVGISMKEHIKKTIINPDFSERFDNSHILHLSENEFQSILNDHGKKTFKNFADLLTPKKE